MTSKLPYVWKTLAVLLAPTLLISCATIIGKSSPESLNVRSSPDQAQVVITDEAGVKIFEGKTPTMISLEKKKGFFSGKKYRVTLSKEGFKDHSVVVDTRVGGWYVGGNLLFGGLIGWLIVDPATGAMWTLTTNEINAMLESLPSSTAGQTPAAQPARQAPDVQQAPQSKPAPQAPAKQTTLLRPNTATIVLLQDVPESLRNKMVRVAQ